jgi:prephenate dehydratase
MKISFQGANGAYSHMSCLAVYPDAEPIPCISFEEALNKVASGETDIAMIPLENSSAGRVADMHWLLPNTSLHIIGEYFHPVHHCLMCNTNADFNTIKNVYSHPQALAQCKKHLKEKGLIPCAYNDTAAAAQMISIEGDVTSAALASKLAAEIYGLKILEEDFQDFSHNTTRFLIFSKNEITPERSERCITSLIFKVKNIPAALYKAMGGFATNGVNMLKLESYMLDGHFSSTQFYVDVEGHKDDDAVKRAFDELHHFADNIKILGCYVQNRDNL